MAAYVRYYPTWHDWPDTSTPAPAAFYKGVEDRLVNSLTIAPVAGGTENLVRPASSLDLALSIGNAPGPASTQYTGTGTPLSSGMPFTLFHYFGQSAPVPGTTQAGAVIAKYFNPTLDDSAEAFSAFVALVNSGTPFTQTLPVTGLEGDALIQGANTLSNKAVGVAGVVKVQNTAHADSTMNFYSALSSVDAGATVTNRYGFYDEGVSGTRPTNVWSLYARENIQTEKSLYVNVTGAQTSNLGIAMVTGPNVSGGATDVPTLLVRPGAGQTTPTFVVQTNGGLARIQMFGASGNIQMGNGATGGSGVGLLSMVTATAPSGTPPAAGAYLYVDPADNKLKAKTSGGTVTVLTPTA